jgi:protein required for attachment to host cells
MATDPVKNIRTLEHDSPLALDVTQALERLANVPPSTEAPYLTVSLDWRPEGSEPGRIPPPEPKRSERRSRGDDKGTSRRPAWETLRRDLDETVKAYGPRGAAFESLSADLERISTYLDEDLDPAAHGVIVVACNHQGVFEPAPLDIPVTTGFSIGPVPSLGTLVHAGIDFPNYAVLIADQREANLWLMQRQTWDRGVQLEANDYPRKQAQGGWSQKRFQNRADERVEAFAKTIAEETRREIAEGNTQIPYLILAADEPMATALNEALHQTVSERIIGTISLEPDANLTTIAAAAEPLVAARERQHERETVQSMIDGVGAGGRGVAGAEDTLTALETGQVMTLVMNDDFEEAGWADFTFPLYGAGAVPREHPAAGDIANIVPVPLADIATRLALQTGADIELVGTAVPVSEDEQEHIPDADAPAPRAKAARSLDVMGGIGAILRFALDDGQPTANR